MDVQDASRPRSGPLRMFDQAALEWLTRTHPASLVAVYVPAVAVLVWRAATTGMSTVAIVALCVAGAFLWSFLEYLIHRFGFHFMPRGRWGVIYAYLVHGCHHAFPEDHRRWVMPLCASLPVVAVLGGIAALALGPYHPPVVAGGIAGYLWYDITHYAIHRGRLRLRVLDAMRRHHLQHHFASPDRKFGVSSTLWDHVFRTAR